MSRFAINTGMSRRPQHVLPSAWTGHLPFAFWVVLEARPRTLVELGSHHGTSYLAFCQAVVQSGLATRCFAVDTWRGDEHAGFYGDEVYDGLRAINDAQFGSFSQLMRMTFDDAATQFGDGSIDLLHIDGLHTYEAVRHDFETWLPKLSARGVVLFHDTTVREREFGVWRLWSELRERYPSFEFQHAHGLGVLLVGPETPQSLRELADTGVDDVAAVQHLFDALGSRVQAEAHAAAIEAALKQALQDAEANRAAAGEAHRYLIGRIDTLEASAATLRDDLARQLVAHDSERDSLQTALSDAQRVHESERDALQVALSDTQLALEASQCEVEAGVARIEEIDVQRAALTRRVEEAAGLARALDDARRQLVALQTERGSLQAALADTTHTLDVLQNSKSWQLTAPLRLLAASRRRHLAAPSVRTLVGRALHAIHRHLPVPLESRLALKSAVFTVAEPLVRHTNAYARWVAFEALRAGAAAPALPPVAPALPPVSDGAPSRDTVATSHWKREVLGNALTPRSTYFVGAPADVPPDAVRAKAIAFYLPQFHPIVENDAWWGRGFTEWRNVAKAVPQFVGHAQPNLPGELGFYDLRLIEVMRRQAELARLHGLHGFCFHHYWFSGRRLLERPVDQYLAQPDIDFPFCLCWANENWTRRWDGHDQDILLGQTYNDDNDLAFIRDLMPYLRDRRYIRVGGRPLVIVYRPSLLPDCRHTLDIWRRYCKAEGLGEIFLAMVQFDVEDPRTYGFDAALEFPPHKVAQGLAPINATLHIVNPDYRGTVVDYRDVVASALNWPPPDYPLFRGVSPGWDNEARKPGNGYTLAHSSPAEYGRWLEGAAAFAEAHRVAGERIVFVNAWNEWAEGAYLEPDARHGYANLAATRRVLERGQRRGTVALISHDAHPHGAQRLAIGLVRELTAIGLDVVVLLQGGGVLESDFEDLAPVHRLYAMSAEQVAGLAGRLRSQGVASVIANTALSGRVTPVFAAAGMRVVTLVHELPGVIAQYGLEAAIAALAECSTTVVVPSEDVRDGLRACWPDDVPATKMVLRPQGLFTHNCYRGRTDRSEARHRLREALGLPTAARIVLAVAYADHRKGVDLLAQAAARCCARNADTHVVWVGHRDLALAPEVDALVEASGLTGRFHFVGLDFDTDHYYAGADVYALSSREDPFPNVVLESLAVGTPVVAFAGTGGGARLVEAHGAGLVVSAFDVPAYADAIDALLDDAERRRQHGQAGSDLVEREFSFRDYALTLAGLAGFELPRVSVVVPNYNYAHYLPQRLAAIAAQTWPVAEVLVLDDASTDHSLDVLQQQRGRFVPEPRVVAGAQNSGSVFKQWRRGVELARGEYVWIAEADDLAKPAFLETLVTALHRRPDVVMAYCESEAIDATGVVVMSDYRSYTADVSPHRWNAAYTTTGADEVDQALAIKNTIPNVSAALFRREALLEVLRAHEDEICGYRIAGDWVTYVRLLERGGLHYEPAALNRHRRHSGSVTSATNRQRHLDEVASAQALAAARFAVSEATRAAAARYSRALREQFGLLETHVEGA